jgi:hypothetical protein
MFNGLRSRCKSRVNGRLTFEIVYNFFALSDYSLDGITGFALRPLAENLKYLLQAFNMHFRLVAMFFKGPPSEFVKQPTVTFTYETDKTILLTWLKQELSDAKDTISSIERGERYKLIRMNADGMIDETQSTYIKAMRDTMFLDLLLDYVKKR